MSKKKTPNQAKKNHDIAIVGMSCWYPGAQNLLQFWENILAKRQQFRRMVDTRLPLADYHSANRMEPDKTYGDKAAFMEGFEFDWMTEKYPKSTYESTDMVHWLALDLASKAIQDAGLSRKTIPLAKTGVLVGNSLTGESSRSDGMRVRWPYFQKVLQITAQNRGLSDEQIKEFLKSTEELYKSLFVPVTEDTLAGSLANTIAGRICNYYNLDGGGYTVDGACASSLLAVANSATALTAGDLDLAIVGGVDVSLDSFELIGFAKVGALAEKEMKVYDRDGKGFIPGEGCGFVLMKRLDDAIRDKNKIYALLKGWGISSDGSGGITAPKASGQAIALKRAYEKAGYKPSACDFIEGHGTGTAVGDKRELEGISIAMNDLGDVKPKSCGMTSLKSIVGHTKAAAGIGAFIKAVMGVNRRVLPPTAGCENPNSIFDQQANMLYPLVEGEVRDAHQTLRAGVSAMGFGGINCHVTVESYGPPSAELSPSLPEKTLMASHSDAELFVFTAQSIQSIKQQVQKQLQEAVHISVAEMTDISAHLATRAVDTMPFRAALVAGNPAEFRERLQELDKMLAHPPAVGESATNELQTIWLSNKTSQPRVGFLFPGQGSQKLNMSKLLLERHEAAAQFASRANEWLQPYLKVDLTSKIYHQTHKAVQKEEIENWNSALAKTEVAQPAICFSSVLWAQRLAEVGIHCQVVAGHSLGELTALHWAGAYDEKDLLQLAALRGKLMSASPDNAGAMVSLSCNRETAAEMVTKVGTGVVIANVNSPQQTVVSGEKAAIEELIKLAGQGGVSAYRLNVSNAFHSPLVAEAAKKFKDSFPLQQDSKPLRYHFVSGSEGNPYSEKAPLKDYLPTQIVSPVDFVSVAKEMASRCDLMIEVGHGAILTGLVKAVLGKNGPQCLPVEAKSDKQIDFLRVVAQYFVAGGKVHFAKLFDRRLVRPYTEFAQKKMFVNPCENPFPEKLLALHKHREVSKSFVPASVPAAPVAVGSVAVAMAVGASPAPVSAVSAKAETMAKVLPLKAEATGPAKDLSRNEVKTILIDVLCQVTGFPADIFKMEMRLLDDLNLDSIKAGEAITALVKRCSIEAALDPIQIANATLDEIIDIIYKLGPKSPGGTGSSGTDSGPAPAAAAPASSAPPTPAAPPVAAASAAPVSIPRKSLDVVIEATSRISGYASDTFSADMELIGDLRVTEKQLEEIVQASCLLLEIRPTLDFPALQNVTIKGLAGILDKLKVTQTHHHNTAVDVVEPVAPSAPAPALAAVIPAKAAPKAWVRNFTSQIVEAPRPQRPAGWTPRHNDQWANARILIVSDGESTPLIDSLQEQWVLSGASMKCESFESVSRLAKTDFSEFNYILCVMPEHKNSSQSNETRVRNAVRRLHFLTTVPNLFSQSRRVTTVACLQFGDGKFSQEKFVQEFDQASTSSFLQTLHIERSDMRIRCIEIPSGFDGKKAAHEIQEELTSEKPYQMVGFTIDGKRWEPALKLSETGSYAARSLQWSSSDVMLVTGGAKGITAECAFAFAKKNGVKLAIVGSSVLPDASSPEARENEALKNLQRFKEAGIPFQYYSCDTSNESQVQTVIAKVVKDLGAITAVLHGAGKNIPRRLTQVSVEDAFAEISPKVLGALHLCQHVPAQNLKLFSTFTSILGLMGVRGNGWYSFSNEALNQLLMKYHEAHPHVATVTCAYGMWEDVGMASKLGSGEKFSSAGVRLIPVQEGVRRYIELTEKNPGVQQVVITSSLWKQSLIQTKRTPSKSMRFLEGLTTCTDGVEAVSRIRLSIDKDLYLLDHKYDGSYLFPTVMGLESMAQLAAFALGKDRIEHMIAEKIELNSAIVVNPKNGIEIEVYAEVQEGLGEKGEQRVKVGVRTETSKFSRDSFAAVLSFPKAMPVETHDQKPGKPLRLDLKKEIYGPVLFHGPTYQRLDAFHYLDGKEVVFSTWQANAKTNQAACFSDPSLELLLGDPFCRDTLLQSGQCVIPQNICLPTYCDKWEFFSTEARSEKRFGFYQMAKIEGKKVYGELSFVDEKGRVLERLTGSQSVIVKTAPQNPKAEEIAARGGGVHLSVPETVQKVAKHLGLPAVTVVQENFPGFSGLSPADRHGREKGLFKAAVQRHFAGKKFNDQMNLSWKASGKPVVENAETEMDVSFSHAGDLCICTISSMPVGCDIESVAKRSQEEWVNLLGPTFSETFLKMERENPKSEMKDFFGTAVWSAREAIGKSLDSKDFAFHSYSKMNLAMIEGFRFEVKMDQRKIEAFIFPHLTEDDREHVVAIAFEKKQAATYAEGPISDDVVQAGSNTYNLGYNEEKGFFVRWPVTFKDASNVKKGIYFSKFFEWQGRARELAIIPLLDSTSQIFSSGEFGWVTNSSEVRVYKSAQVGDVIEGRVTSGVPYGKSNSSVDVFYDWYRIDGSGHEELVAQSQMVTTWVKIISHGVVDVAPFPQEFLNFFSVVARPEVRRLPVSQENTAETYYVAPPGVATGPVLSEHVFDTSLEDSNLVGNIYFSNYSSWLGRTRDIFFHRVMPQILQTDAKGELFCTGGYIKHLREAMPFDKVQVVMRLKTMTATGLKLYFEFFRYADGKRLEKIAYADHEVTWCVEAREGLVPDELPPILLYYLKKAAMDDPASELKPKKTASAA